MIDKKAVWGQRECLIPIQHTCWNPQKLKYWSYTFQAREDKMYNSVGASQFKLGCRKARMSMCQLYFFFRHVADGTCPAI